MYLLVFLTTNINIFIKDEPTSKVHGFVYDNTFEGRIYIDGKTAFVVESSYPHRAHVDQKKYHSVIYKASDIKPLPFDSCRSVYGHPRDDVEQPIKGWYLYLYEKCKSKLIYLSLAN